MIHVCYAIYDKIGSFSRIAAASLQSLYDNTDAWVTIHILHDNTLSEENKEKYIYQARMQDKISCSTTWMNFYQKKLER